MSIYKNADDAPATSVTITDKNGNPQIIEMVVDSGASQSVVNTNLVKGMLFDFKGLVEIMTPQGPSTLAKVGGGSMKFKAQPPGSTNEVDVTCGRDFLLGKISMLGNEQMAAAKVEANIDMDTKVGYFKSYE